MRRALFAAVVVLGAIVTQASGSGGAPTPPAEPTVTWHDATCSASSGIGFSVTYDASQAAVTFTSIGVSERQVLDVPFPTGQAVSQWWRSVSYSRGAGVTGSQDLTLDTTDNTTWDRHGYITGYTAPTTDTWYEAWVEVTVTTRGQSSTAHASKAYLCPAGGGTATPQTITYPTWIDSTAPAASGLGSR